MAEPTEDGEFEAFAEAYEEHRDALFDILSEYADENDIGDDLLTALLLDLAVSTRMVVYANSVEKPSAGGLRLDLDRFLKEIGDHVREVKKDAEGFIAEIRAEEEKG